MAQTHEHTFTLDDEREITVTYTATGGSPGNTFGPPEDCEPAETPEIEIVTAHDEAGNVVTLTQEQDEKFCDWLAENHEDDFDDYAGWD